MGLETDERRLLVEKGGHARYVPSGHLLYASEGVLLAAPFDPERLELTGPAVPVIEGAMTGLPGEPSITHFAVSRNGTIIYLPGSFQSAKRSLVWVDREGREEALRVEPRYYGRPLISPEGLRE